MNPPMAGLQGQQFVIIRVPNVVDEADFFGRVFNAGATTAGEARHVNTGSFIMRIERCESDKDRSRNIGFEISVDNVNKFAEEVWNRGVKYASRPQNHADGLRRVAFVSPGDIKVSGVGPLKLDSTGAFSPFKPGT
jgi:hypothetical protein